PGKEVLLALLHVPDVVPLPDEPGGERPADPVLPRVTVCGEPPLTVVTDRAINVETSNGDSVALGLHRGDNKRVVTGRVRVGDRHALADVTGGDEAFADVHFFSSLVWPDRPATRPPSWTRTSRVAINGDALLAGVSEAEHRPE